MLNWSPAPGPAALAWLRQTSPPAFIDTGITLVTALLDAELAGARVQRGRDTRRPVADPPRAPTVTWGLGAAPG
jgi:hypothetical protein